MTRKAKGRNGGDRATRKTSYNRTLTATASRIEGCIVVAASRGVPPVKLADWIVRRLRLGAA